MYSVGISYRGLRNDEQLDFSRKAGNDFCGNYRYSAARNTGSKFNRLMMRLDVILTSAQPVASTLSSSTVCVLPTAIRVECECEVSGW